MSNHDLIQRNETNTNSMGGTELLQQRLYDGSVPRELLEQFQIVFSRKRELDPTKFRIFYAHDLPGDPESDHLANGGWKNYHMLVFVSNWQMQAYINHYMIPWSKCFVIPNSIIPIDVEQHTYGPTKHRIKDKIKLIYTSTPHRGLNILYSVFDALTKKYDNIELDVYSSFKLYGWEHRDEQYKELFALLRAHPKINYHGTASNEEVRTAVELADIFAYPSIWQETSCLCLIEAMSAGLLCVHPNYGALSETAANHTMMYQWDEDINRHANIFYAALDQAIQMYGEQHMNLTLRNQMLSTNQHHDWKRRAGDWIALMTMIVSRDESKALPTEMFSYNV